MNSQSGAHPRGIGASSGVLGHYLMDHSAGNVYFTMPDVRDDGGKYDLFGSDSIMIPRYQNLGAKREDYLRGFGIWGGIQRLPVPAFLRKNPEVAFGFLCGRSETLPHFDNRVELDPEVKDAWGLPAAHIVCEWKEHDLALAAAARRETQEVVEAAGGKVADVTEIFHTPFVAGHIKRMQKEWKLSTPGMFVHEVGGARMGSDAEDLGPRSLLPRLGHAERVRDRRRVLADVGVAEPDAHGDGGHGARVRPRDTRATRELRFASERHRRRIHARSPRRRSPPARPLEARVHQDLHGGLRHARLPLHREPHDHDLPLP